MKNKNYKSKRALSTVVSVLIIILVTMAAIAIVWTFVRNMVIDNRDQVESCYKVESSEKVILNGLYTCYNVISTEAYDEIQISIGLGDVDIDSLIVSAMYEGSSESFTLTHDVPSTSTPNLRPYGGTWSDVETLPEQNAGKTYVLRVDDVLTGVDWIKIAPVINGKQCGVTDQIYDVSDCSLIVP
jgi:hypothetical protein